MTAPIAAPVITKAKFTRHGIRLRMQPAPTGAEPHVGYRVGFVAGRFASTPGLADLWMRGDGTATNQQYYEIFETLDGILVRLDHSRIDTVFRRGVHAMVEAVFADGRASAAAGIDLPYRPPGRGRIELKIRATTLPQYLQVRGFHAARTRAPKILAASFSGTTGLTVKMPVPEEIGRMVWLEVRSGHPESTPFLYRGLVTAEGIEISTGALANARVDCRHELYVRARYDNDASPFGDWFRVSSTVEVLHELAACTAKPASAESDGVSENELRHRALSRLLVLSSGDIYLSFAERAVRDAQTGFLLFPTEVRQPLSEILAELREARSLVARLKAEYREKVGAALSGGSNAV